MKYLWGSLIIFTIACVVIAIYGISVRRSKPEITGGQSETIYYSDRSIETKINDSVIFKQDKDGNVQIGDNNLHIISNGQILIGMTELKTVEITIERLNELLKGDWKLIDYYIKNDCSTYLWENKVTGERMEGMGSHPPSERLIVVSNPDYLLGISGNIDTPLIKLKIK